MHLTIMDLLLAKFPLCITQCAEPITPSVQKELLPMCYLSDESPTKLSDSGHVTETSDDLSDDNLLYFKVPDVKLTGKRLAVEVSILSDIRFKVMLIYRRGISS